MNSRPFLYSFRRCPYAMRARMGLLLAGIQCEVQEVILRDKPAHMLEISPKGTVPVLQTVDGKVIDESLDIMFWALKQNDPDNILKCDIGQAKQLITQNDGEFKAALDRYKYPNRYPDEDCSGARDKGRNFLEELEGLLSCQQQLMADHVSLADIAIFPFVRQFANTNREWFDQLDMPHLQKWLEAHLSSDLFTRIMKKHKQERYLLLG
ncbi:MAG: glutathione S-transferase [Alphaproteobacteria bacterium]|nr:glutathione S-transferase [Alphaproteobacteria bacterium]